MPLPYGYLRSKRGQVSVLSAGIGMAAAFAVLGTNAAAPAVPFQGGVPVASEVWYRSDTRMMVAVSLDPRSITLFVLVLLAGAAFFANGARNALRAWRRDVTTLRALGWSRKHVRRRLMQEFALIAVAAGLLAVLAVCAVEAVLGGRPVSGWPLLSMPAAVAMTLATAWWLVQRVTAEPEPTAIEAARRPAAWRQPRVAGQALRNLRRRPARTALGALVIAVACAALGLELAVRWVFSDLVVGFWPGRAVPWQANAVDIGAVLVILAMATVTVADIDWLTAGDRATELRTLRAIGWPASGVVRLVAWEAVLLGLAGGLVASVLEVAGSLAVVHHAPVRLLLAAAMVAGAGTVVSLAGVSLAAAAGRARGHGVSR